MAEGFMLVLSLLWEKIVDIIQQPIANTDMLWMLIPMIAALFLMELYFGRYKEEELGWNTAVSNSLVLFFVGMNLCYFLSINNMLVGLGEVSPAVFDMALKKSFIAYFIIIESIFLLVLNFFHLAAKRFAFGVSSGLILNFVGIMAIIFIYSTSEVLLSEWITIPAILVIFIAMILFFLIIKALSPKAEEELEEEEEE